MNQINEELTVSTVNRQIHREGDEESPKFDFNPFESAFIRGLNFFP